MMCHSPDGAAYADARQDSVRPLRSNPSRNGYARAWTGYRCCWVSVSGERVALWHRHFGSSTAARADDHVFTGSRGGCSGRKIRGFGQVMSTFEMAKKRGRLSSIPGCLLEPPPLDPVNT